MTPDRYRECLAALGLSQRGLAPILGCSDRITRAWATGRSAVPVAIAEWLEAWVAIRLAHPDPKPPADWHHSRQNHRGTAG
jgi:ribosome-binding protein aMBF1 (putative translation factor)